MAAQARATGPPVTLTGGDRPVRPEFRPRIAARRRRPREATAILPPAMSPLRRLPPAFWILLPALLGGLYAVGHALLAPAPRAGALAPPGAVVTWRYRDLPAYERLAPGPRGPGAPPVRDRLAQARNLPELTGVSRTRPVLEVWLPVDRLRDETLAILPVEDAQAFEAHFNDTARVERGFLRHAQHLERRGDWAAIGADRAAVRRLGGGGLMPLGRGADLAVAADLAGLAALALARADLPPWRSILGFLGLRVDAASPAGSGSDVVVTLPGGRALGAILDGWERAELHAYEAEGRVEVDLWPRTASPLPEALAAARAAAPARALPAAPARAPWELYVTGGAARRALALALLHLGVRLTHAEALPDAVAELSHGLGAPEPDAPLLVYADHARGTGATLDLGVIAPAGALPDLTALLGPLPEPGNTREAAAGPTPPGPEADGAGLLPGAGARLRRERLGEGEGAVEVLALGPSPEAYAAGLAREWLAPSVRRLAAPAGHVLVATFRIHAGRAAALLGAALEPGGLLAVLAGGPIEGEVLTDGTGLRVVARVVRGAGG